MQVAVISVFVMFSGGQQVQSSPVDPTSPPRGAVASNAGTRLVGTKAMNSSQLKARLFVAPEIHSNKRPQLKVARRRSKTDEVCKIICAFFNLHTIL